MKSPLRWPGAKTKLKKEIIRNLPTKTILVEPFVGGGSIFLAFLSSFSERRAIINDADEGVYNLWRIILEGTPTEFDRLIEKIRKVKPSVERFYQLKESKTGFAALCVNRWAFSGNLTAGPIGGKNQKSSYDISCRFRKEEIIRELKTVRSICKGRVSVYCGDFAKLIVPKNAVVYADPPYIEKGNQLYRKKMNPRDHRRLYKWITKLSNKWWLSYDDNPEIRELYKNFTIRTISILYTTKGERRVNNKTTEILITNDNIVYQHPKAKKQPGFFK